MRFAYRWIGVLGITAGFTAGCGGSSGDGALPLDRVAAEYAAALCHKIFTCCEAAERSTTMTDEATCRSTETTAANGVIAFNKMSIDAGRVAYDGDHARRCLDAFSAMPCARWGGNDEALGWIPDCLLMFAGTVPVGGECDNSGECAGAGLCDTCSGAPMCRERAGIGESCVGTVCAPGLHCAYDASSVPTVCASPLPDGAACMFNSDCASGACETNVCGPPTTCNGV